MSTLHHLWKVLEDRRGARALEKSHCHSNHQKGQERGPRELQAGQPQLHPGKDDGATHSRGHHQASGRKEGYQEYSAWIHQGEIMLDQNDSFLWWCDWLARWEDCSGWCLPRLQQGFWHCLPQHPHREAQDVWAGWVVREVDWELAEWQNSEGCRQWQSLVGGL